MVVRRGWRKISGLTGVIAAAAVLLMSPPNAMSQTESGVDVALFVAVDVSESVDENRYRLQMEGIARALEDREVIQAIAGGSHGGIAVSVIAWADKVDIAVPWRIIRTIEDGRAVAELVRKLPHFSGEYTCLERMMTTVREAMLDDIPVKADKVVIDVSGDGIDNCAEPTETDAARDALVARSVTINGLPILVKGENDLVGQGAYRAPGFGLKPLPRGAQIMPMALDQWFKLHVIGGPAAFIRPAKGYEDFGTAFRQKFVTEVSGLPLPREKSALASAAR